MNNLSKLLVKDELLDMCDMRFFQQADITLINIIIWHIVNMQGEVEAKGNYVAKTNYTQLISVYTRDQHCQTNWA